VYEWNGGGECETGEQQPTMFASTQMCTIIEVLHA
jgi:hypothetical protein